MSAHLSRFAIKDVPWHVPKVSTKCLVRSTLLPPRTPSLRTQITNFSTSKQLSSFKPRIAIIGGGPAGLTLSRLLQIGNIATTTYDLRKPFTATELAKPSGMLDLHDESGLNAIRECGLWADFEACLGDCSESARVLHTDGRVLHEDDGELSTRPEISRNALTNLLIESLPADVVKWGSKVVSATRVDNGSTGAPEIMLDFGESGRKAYDFVVGADGAWSRIRNLLTPIKPFYSGEQYITVTVRNVSDRYPQLSDLNGSGSLAALGGGNGLMTHRGPQDSIRLYIAIKTPDEHWVKVKDWTGKTAAEIKDALLSDEKLFANWAPMLQDLISVACDEDAKDNPDRPADIKPMYMLPVGHQWDHQAGTTLIGDAAHLMTPWAGEGVNLAMWDALDLAKVLVEVPEAEDAVSWHAAVEPRLRKFEEIMLDRAREKAEETVKNRDMFLSENGSQLLADFFASAYGQVDTAHDSKS